ncbi:hypothetical protein JET76_08345 [Pseudomonas putida]|uniref:DUF560 domain-containing protein n=1 Tax=Pseudomonas putida TaxID=303 RepID=A0A7W2L1V7_PSEPU|nr:MULTISPECIES: hypothetical protein [Pseudomonas]MBA6116885.1 hypothetical protein [Pseudomonas putida]MBI6941348.1 hypothetical protein [Pseudomonas putida]MBI6959586.1 hypothetical protein [Pseudomonas putida]MCZ9637592.1 hypothetical protein [Pseudomonas putida]PZQ42991.1 MAG: hypothetical protein DI560_00380 [Pseudomonas putida]
MMMPLAGVAYAANWQSSVVVPTTVEYDSNPLLLTSKEKGVTRTIIAPDYNLIGQFDRDQLRLGLGMHLLRSSDRSVVDDREDPNLSLGWQRETETGGFGLLAQYNESSTLSGAVLDTGVVTTDGTQKMSSLTANWSSAVTERSTLANEARYNHARYDINTLTGYDEYSNYLSWTYAWNERTDIISGFEARRYVPQDTTTAVATNSYVPSIGIRHQFSEQLEGAMHVGVNETSGSGGGRRGEGGLSLFYRGARNEASLSAERSTVANAEGGFAQLDMVRGTWSYLLTETRRIGADASWQDSKGQTPNTLQTYSVWASQEFSRAWDLRFSLMYKERQQNGLPDAEATIVGLTLTYRYPDI